MFFLNSSEDAHTFFADYRRLLMTAVENGIQSTDDCHDFFTRTIIRESVAHHNTYRTPEIHYRVTEWAAQLFGDMPGVRVDFGPNHSLVLVFKDKVQVRFQKMNRDFTFPTNNGTKREQDFRNPSANLFGQLPLESVYAAYRLKSSGELADLQLVGMDEDEGKWFYNVGRSTGEDPLDIPFTQEPVTPIVNPDELVRPRRKNA
ncbi:MAG: hypothetical protein ACRYFZ_11880 [Janthinobacterium lividum]